MPPSWNKSFSRADSALSAVSLHSEKILVDFVTCIHRAKCMLRISNLRGEYSQLQLYDSRSGFRPDACQNGKFSVVGLVLWLLPSFCLLLGFPLV